MEVYVYRNLKHGRKSKPLYSIMHRGRVIDRRPRVLISGATFVVRPAGRRRALAEGRKNVHAFVKGRLVDDKGIFGIDADGRDFPVGLSYTPQMGAFFQTATGWLVKGARGVLLNERGMSACYLEG